MNGSSDIVDRLSLLEKAALLSGANTWQTRAIPRVDLSSIWMADGPHGLRKQSGSADHLGINDSITATCFPTAATIANSWDEDLANRIGVALGREAAAQEVDVLLGPGLNIKRSPLGGRGFEYFSEDPELAGRLAAAFVRGIQSEGVAATPKHFAVNSQELRRMVSDSVLDERTLREIYLTAFEIVVRESRPWAMMSAYNLVNGEYAHENEHLLMTVLRDEWGFDGAVISDWGGGNDSVRAAQAGGTLEMPSPGFDSARTIVEAVSAGALAETDLDARVGEVVALVRRVQRRPTGAEADLGAHHELARSAAAESIVLLRNEGEILPLAAGATVAVIGDLAATPRYQGAGSSLVNSARVVSLLEAVQESSLQMVGFANGYRRDGQPDAGLLREATVLATTADVVVLAVGIPEIEESEGADRPGLALPSVQQAVIAAVHAANPRTVVVLSAGGVVETPWLTHTAALLHAYLGGQASGAAVLDVLVGAVNPGGRLAETFPHSLAHTPTAERFPSTARTAEYREGLFVGYRHYQNRAADVAFPFGFGLSYTTFTYSDLTLDDSGASFTVENTGIRAGSEVAQMYIRREGVSRVIRVGLELKGFAKLRLEPGESARVTLPFGDRAFRFFDVDTDAWQIERGRYRVSVGSNLRDQHLSDTIFVEGTVDTGQADPELATFLAADARGVTDDDFAALLGRVVPHSSWPDGPLGINDPIGRLESARSPLARWIFRAIDRRRLKAERAGTPDLNIMFLVNAPFRVISKMSGGLATAQLTQAVLVVVNGRPLRGLIAIVSAFIRGRMNERRTAAAFRSAATKGTEARR